MGSPSEVGARVVGKRYRLLERLGQGGMGTVWKAHDDVLSRTVAIKEVDLPAMRESDRAQLRERTMREARAAARLNHPNAVTVYDVVEDGGQPWIVMQLVAAESLADAVRDRGPLPPGRVAKIGLAVLDALQAAHAAGILHRDVKPGNVLLGHDGRVVLTDFGIATLEGDPSLTGTGMLLGAPAYIAPERARGLRPGPASDLWSLGATLYTAVEGRPPYERDTPLATLTALMTEEPPTPAAAGPLTPVLQGLLEHDPARRLDAAGARRMLERARDLGADPPATQPLPQVTDAEEPPVAPAVKAADRTQVIPRPDPVPMPAQSAAAAQTAPPAEPVQPAQSAQSAQSAPATQPAPPVPTPQPVERAGAPVEPTTPRSAPPPQQRSAPPAMPPPAMPPPAMPPAVVRPAAPAQTGPAGPRDRRRLLVAVLLSIALLAAVGTVLLIRNVKSPGRQVAGPGSSPKPSATTSAPSSSPGSTSPSPGSSSSPGSSGSSSGASGASGSSPTSIPAGYTKYTDPTGAFSIGVPNGWRSTNRTGSSKAGAIDFVDPSNSGRHFRFAYTTSPKSDPVADWKSQASSHYGGNPDYHKISINPVPYRSYNTADWEFLLGTTRVLDRGFTTGTRGYAIELSAPASQWNESLQYFNVAAATFQPIA